MAAWCRSVGRGRGVAALILVSLAAVAGAAEEPPREAVFVSGRGGYHTYRIPALLVTKKGTLLAFCEGRKTGRADDGDIDLLLRRSEDGGRTWQPVQRVYEEEDARPVTIGNPCPVLDRQTGRIWLPFCRDNRDVLVTWSDDEGRTWAEPREITDAVKRPDWGWYATGPGVGIQLLHGPHRGRLLIPCDHRDADGRKVTSSHVIFSDDHGRTWQLGGTVAPHTNECQLAELRDGRLMINMRNYWGREGDRPERGGLRAVATSDDGGRTWSELRFDSTLIEPLCQASLIGIGAANGDDAAWLLFANPASQSKRHRLTVRLSTDGGHSWPVAKVLHAGPAAYCCLAALPEGAFGCLYEAGETDPYESLVFARFSRDWLTQDVAAAPARRGDDAAARVRRVLVIGIDGCRTDALLAADAPHLHRLMKEGAFSDRSDVLGRPQSGADTVSGPGWSSLLTGVWPDKHGVMDNGFKDHHLAEHPSLLGLIRQARPEAKTAAFVSWPPLAEQVFREGEGCRLFAAKDRDEYIRADRQVADAAVELLSHEDPVALFVYFGQVDETGHQFGFHPLLPQYTAAIAAVDEQVGRILEALRARKSSASEEWLILVGTDHGGRGARHGGGKEFPEVRQTFLILHGPRVVPGPIDGPTENVDLVCTALHHLGIQPAADWQLDGHVRAQRGE